MSDKDKAITDVIVKKIEKVAKKQNCKPEEIVIQISEKQEKLQIHFIVDGQKILNTSNEVINHRVSDVVGPFGMGVIRAYAGGEEPTRVIKRGLKRYLFEYNMENIEKSELDKENESYKELYQVEPENAAFLITFYKNNWRLLFAELPKNELDDFLADKISETTPLSLINFTTLFLNKGKTK